MLGRYLAGLLAAVALTGCAHPQPVAHRPSGPSTAMVDFATRSGSWPGDEEDVENAFNRLDQRCLQAQGIDDPVSPPVRIPVPQDEAATVDLAGRRSIGYALADATAPRPEPSFTGSSERFRAAQFGPASPHLSVVIEGNAKVDTPSGGCLAEGHSRLAGDVTTWTRLYYLPQRFDERLSAAMTQDARYPAALAAWSTCMRARGYSYAGPDYAEAALRSQYQKFGVTAALEQQEIRTAVDDGYCQLAEHLPTELLQIRRSLVAGLPRSDLEALAAMSDLRRNAVARARSVLAEPGQNGQAAR